MQVVILDDANTVAVQGAAMVALEVRNNPHAVLGLATGSTPLLLYNRLINANRCRSITFSDVTTFNLDEYLGLDSKHPQSYRHFMNEHLFNHIDIKSSNTFIPDGNAENPFSECQRYESLILDRGGVDFQLLGIGRNGHIGFNEPSSGLNSRTRVKALSPATIEDNARFFSRGEFQPHLSITMGVGTIMEAKKVVLMATGESKAMAIKEAIEGPISASCPASMLQMHKNATVIIDESAASLLENKQFYKHTEDENRQLMKRMNVEYAANIYIPGIHDSI